MHPLLKKIFLGCNQYLSGGKGRNALSERWGDDNRWAESKLQIFFYASYITYTDYINLPSNFKPPNYHKTICSNCVNH